MGGAIIKSLDDLLTESERLIILLNLNDFDPNVYEYLESLIKDINDFLSQDRASIAKHGKKISLLQEKVDILSNLLREKMDLIINKLNDKSKELEYLYNAKKTLIETL
ncbi:chromosome segregation protein SMC [Sulfurihydrogenibium sp.]|uniref:chromosome segregation protein SMC n=1 Tax=Sulfurihydrogenibium sp. TaxID=2053621 RepID=UPI002608B11F|nr:chromosome segregation protein SMC [Sulfurihydrogenibium sp.]